MLRISSHAIYRYAKRAFYQDVCDKRRDLSPKSYNMVGQALRNKISNLPNNIPNGKYPLEDSDIKILILDNTVVTVLYK